MALVWGVEKIFTIKRDISESHIFYQFLQKVGKKELYIVTMGSHSGVKGSTNMVRLLDDAAREKIFKRFEK